MSLSFSSEQYNQEFTPKRLGMYEVPKEQLSKVSSWYTNLWNSLRLN